MYDYVVIGGGSAGCVVAAELASDPDNRVMLLETGAPAESHPETLRADGYKDAFVNDALMHERFSVPQPSCAGQALFMGSGRGMGGSGSINGMVYTRGAALDYDEWPEGWRWADVVPDFEAVERRLDVRRRPPTEFTEACIRAAESAGFARKEDLNDGDLHGVLGYEWMNYRGADRRSSYVAFLKDGGPRPNLAVVTGASAHRLRFDSDRRVRAVEYAHGGGTHTVHVGREVVLCAGALETPKLLMLSGVGPGEELRRHALPVVHEQPAVGRNFHDHPNATVFFRGRRPVDCFYPQLYGFHRARPATALPPGQSDTCYVFYPARSSFREALIRLLPGIVLPQPLYRMPAAPAALRAGIAAAFRSARLRAFVERLYGIVVILGKPLSRGTVGLSSHRPQDCARIDPRYFEHPEDLETMIDAVELTRRIAAGASLREWGNREIVPGPIARSRASVGRWVRGNAMTTYHFAGTCRMGGEDAVVDRRLRVRGVTGLRVADASVVPTTPVSALNAPSMLVGYRAARFIREERATEVRA